MSVKSHWITYAVVAGALTLGSACGAGGIPNYDYASEPNPIKAKAEFVIGVSDVLQITVWENPNLSAELVVRPDGTITLPLIGDLPAAGKAPTQLKKEITTRLRQYIKEQSAVVTVAVTEVHSYRFSVSGEVANAGVFNRTYYVTVVEALALAGGFTRFASRDKILIIRQDGAGGVRKIPINYDAISRGAHQEMNVVILAGDQVVVP